MAALFSIDAMLLTLRHTIVALARGSQKELTARQFGVFLTCYLNDGPLAVGAWRRT